jgi:hypothetical protein
MNAPRKKIPFDQDPLGGMIRPGQSGTFLPPANDNDDDWREGPDADLDHPDERSPHVANLIRPIPEIRTMASIFAEFVAAGYSPIPRYEIDGKHVWPKRWSDFCDRQATDAERAKWGPPDGVALCCGYGNLLAVDVDTDDLQIKKAVIDALPHCHIARHGSKGYALLVRYQGERIPSIYPADENCKQPLVEFKGYGANITVPPSRHAKTRSPYSWLDVEAGEIIEAVPPLDKLPIVTPADIKRVQEALAPYALAPRKRESISSGSSSAEVKPGRHAAYFKAGYERETKALAALSEGRPTALFRAVCSLGWGVHHGVIGKAEFAAGFIDACKSNGLLDRDGIRAIEATISSGLARSANDALPELKDTQQPELRFTAGVGERIFEEDAYGDDPGPKPTEDPGKTDEAKVSDEPEPPDCVDFDDLPWETEGKNKEPRRNEWNLRLALQFVGVSVGYNEFHYKEEIKGLPNHGPWLANAAIDALWAYIWRACEMKYPKGDFEALLLAVIARENKTHPVRAYLKRLKWDDKPRLDTWLCAYLGADDTPANRIMGRKFLIAAVRRARKPGCKFDQLLVLEGAQDAGKSRTGRALCPDEDWFSENVSLCQDAKEIIEQTEGKWIAEIGELAGLSKRDAEHVKQMLSRQSDESRLAYGRLRESRPRQFVMLATTNQPTYLTDPTGNRRFWPVKVGKIDISAIERDRDQLWAEAAHYEAQDEPIYVKDDAIRRALRAAQEEREEHDAWEDAVQEWKEKLVNANTKFEEAKLSLSWIAYAVLNIEEARFNMAEQKRLANVLRRCGFELKKSDGKRWWQLVPVSAGSARPRTDSAPTGADSAP